MEKILLHYLRLGRLWPSCDRPDRATAIRGKFKFDDLQLMNSLLAKAADSLAKKGDPFSAVVLYEDHATRDRAMDVCDRLVHRFWADVEFDFSWWRFDFLRDSTLAGDAVRVAARSELILLAAHAGREGRSPQRAAGRAGHRRQPGRACGSVPRRRRGCGRR